MLVVNKGTSGAFHIFRGSQAKEFIGAIEVVAGRKVIVTLRENRVERGQFFLTKAGTGLLCLPAEDLTDELAQQAFNRTAKQFLTRWRRMHGSA